MSIQKLFLHYPNPTLKYMRLPPLKNRAIVTMKVGAIENSSSKPVMGNTKKLFLKMYATGLTRMKSDPLTYVGCFSIVWTTTLFATALVLYIIRGRKQAYLDICWEVLKINCCGDLPVDDKTERPFMLLNFIIVSLAVIGLGKSWSFLDKSLGK